MSRFLYLFVLATIAIVVGAMLVVRFGSPTHVPLAFWFSLAFIALLSLTIHRFLLQAEQKRPAIFVNYFMLSMTIKLLCSGMLLVIVGLTAREQLNFTAIGYAVAYMVYTVLEIGDLLPRMRSK